MNIEEYLKKFDAVTKDPSLDAMKFFMEEFGNPQKKTKFIHIAGTNGKGSVCEMINNILVNAGYKVGKYISPHLIKYNERITINNIEITDEEISDMLQEISEKVDIYNKMHEVPVKEFEVITTLALIYFARQKCDFVVLETGLGGTYDCTNIADGIISIITNIGLDHVDILGSTIEEITNQKAGIIKENNDTIMCNQEKVTDIIKEKCKEKYEKRKKQNEVFYYLKDTKTNEYVGYANYSYNKKENRYYCGIVIEYEKRGKGYAKEGLKLLCERAKENKIKALYDNFEKERNCFQLFKELGFYVVEETTYKKMGKEVKGVVVKKDL